MARRNRVDPFGDLHAVPERGMFTGNRGCLVDETGRLARHHRANLWITCVLSYQDWRNPLAQPGRWTPLFFLDDAVALAAGHRPCGLCRRGDYLAYRSAVEAGLGGEAPISAVELNRRLATERLNRGRGLARRGDRKMWVADVTSLPDGTVVVVDGNAHLLLDDRLRLFDFSGWGKPIELPHRELEVLTPPTSVLALTRGFTPRLHESIARPS